MNENPHPSLQAYVLAILAGSTIFLGLSPFSLWYIPIVGIALFAALCRPNYSAFDHFKLALAFHFGLMATGAHWIYVSIATYGQVPVPMAVLFVAGFALFLACICALPWLFLSKIAKTPGARLIAFPAFLLLSEWTREWAFTGFPWLYIGHGHVHSPLAGWVPVLGSLGTGLIVTATSVAIVWLISEKTLRAAAAALPSLAAIWVSGYFLQGVEWTIPKGAPVNTKLVQPAIALEDKWDRFKADENLSILVNYSQQPLENTLLIWPEAALPYLGESALAYMSEANTKAADSNTAFISGYLTQDLETGRFYNAVGGTGNAEGQYLKQRLVPFGEYVPLENWIRDLMYFFNLPTSFIYPGTGDQTGLKFNLNDEEYGLAPAICYEIAYASLVANLAQDSEVILTLSNDAWFGDSIGPWQHMELAQVRALENRKPVLRATNSGISASTNHYGKILDSIPQFEPGTVKTKIQPMAGLTPFAKYKNSLALGISIFILGLSFFLSRKLSH